MTLHFDPSDPSFLADPYPTWAELRRGPRVHRSPEGFAVVTRYHDVAAALRDPRLRKGPVTAAFARRYGVDLPQATTFSLIDLDPPEHTRLRALLGRPFSPDAARARRDNISQAFERLWAVLEAKSTFDVIVDLAYPLLATVIGDLLGVPRRDREVVLQWGLDIALGLDVLVRTPAWEQASAQLRARRDAGDYFDRLIHERRRKPGDDLISQWISAQDGGAGLTDEELRASCVLMIVAGHETTVNLIGNGTAALLARPLELDRLARSTALTLTGVHELLRFDPPGQATIRIAAEELFIGEHQVHEGETVVLSLAAANRDAEHFIDADALDLSRSPNRHLSFGAGAHACLGAPLALLMGEIVFEKLASALGGARVLAGARRRGSALVRGYLSLPIERAPHSFAS